MKKAYSPGYFLTSLLSFLIFCSCMLPGMAHADVWGYIDSKGIAHFASEKIDERYELFFKTPAPADKATYDVNHANDAMAVKPFSSSQAKQPALSPSAQSSMPPAASHTGALPSSLLARQSKLLAFFEISPAFKAVRQHMRDAAKAHSLDFELLQALIATESGFDLDAISPKGAVGLMQIMPATADRYGVTGDEKMPIEKKLTDPKTNIRLGARHLRNMMNLFPQRLDLALAAYNAGEGAVQRHGNKIPPFKETQNYVVTVMQIYQQLKPPSLLPKSAGPAPTATTSAGRVRAEFPGMGTGQIPGRGNMVPALSATLPAPATSPSSSSIPSSANSSASSPASSSSSAAEAK
jgi:soluble lytic murein transglycosylase-like protein